MQQEEQPRIYCTGWISIPGHGGRLRAPCAFSMTDSEPHARATVPQLPVGHVDAPFCHPRATLTLEWGDRRAKLAPEGWPD